jgi:hypothetical protein
VLKLSDRFPKWLKIKEHSNEGTLVILSKDIPMGEIFSALKSDLKFLADIEAIC